MIVVTNRNGEEHHGKFDGKEYVFPPNQPVSVPEDVAMHLFAYGKGDVDRARVLIRNGWQRTGDNTSPFGPKAAMEKLQRFAFQVIEDPPPVPKAKRVVTGPQPKLQRQPTGVNAMSSLVDERGQRKPNGTINLPGSAAPIAPASGTA